MYKYVGIALLLSLIVTTGCTPNAANAQFSEPSFVQTLESASGAVEMKTVPVSIRSAVRTGIDANKVQGDIKNIFYASRSTVLVDADQLYLYDFSSGEVLEEVSKENFRQSHYQSCGKGYAAIGTLQNSLKGKIVFYSDTLKKESELSFSQIIDSDDVIFPENFAVSPDGKKIAAYFNYGITVYDTETSARTRILDLNKPDVSSIMHIDQLAFTSDSQSLILLSGVNGGNGQSLSACGKINIDGTGLVNQKISGFTPYEIIGAYDKFALFGEDDRFSSGRVVSLDAATGSSKFLPLATKREQAAFGSNTGLYYATSQLNNSGCIIRIYETATGNKVFEQSVPHGGNNLYSARNPVIRVLDETKTCIILMGNRQDDLATKVAFLQF